MIDDAVTKQRIEVLEHAVKRARLEECKVSVQLLAASLNPMSTARAGLKARHAALVRLADGAQAEIERLHEGPGR